MAKIDGLVYSERNGLANNTLQQSEHRLQHVPTLQTTVMGSIQFIKSSAWPDRESNPALVARAQPTVPIGGLIVIWWIAIAKNERIQPTQKNNCPSSFVFFRTFLHNFFESPT